MNHPICSPLSLTAPLVAASGPAAAQDERTMALVTIAEANAECLTRTRSMPADKAALVDRFLTSNQVEASTRQAVKASRDFATLKADYIAQQGLRGPRRGPSAVTNRCGR